MTPDGAPMARRMRAAGIKCGFIAAALLGGESDPRPFAIRAHASTVTYWG